LRLRFRFREKIQEILKYLSTDYTDYTDFFYFFNFFIICVNLCNLWTFFLAPESLFEIDGGS
jgi:hypothetical protein